MANLIIKVIDIIFGKKITNQTYKSYFICKNSISMIITRGIAHGTTKEQRRVYTLDRMR
jgi:hypothetical protein